MKPLVRTTVMCLALGVVSAPLRAQVASTEWTQLAESFIRKQQQGEFEGAVAMLAPQTRAQLDAAKLEGIWKQLTAAGALAPLVVEAVQEAQGYHVVDLAASFGAQKLKLRVSLDAEKRVGGYWVLPPTPPKYQAPSYVDSTRFTEETLQVGVPEYPLKAILTLPKGVAKPPVLVLVHGSGPNDENETVGPSQPFRDLAWGLATKGIAVLRYDKRTHAHGGRLTGRITVEEETIVDALSALDSMRRQPAVNGSKVFLLGHSLGGMLAPEIADRDARLAGVIALAGSPRGLHELITDQMAYLVTLPGNQSAEAKAQIAEIEKQMGRIQRHEVPPDSVVMGAPASYYYDLDARNAIAHARRVQAPMLFLQGGRDYQVTTKDYELWQQALKERPNVSFQLYPDLSHLFMSGQGMATPTEYMSEQKHVAEQVLDDIAAFIRAH